MPSISFNEFSKNLTDVRRIVTLHLRQSRPDGTGKPGKRALGHLTRGGIVLLCAAWERYVESVLEEGAVFLATNHTLASLPAIPKKLVIDFVNGGKSSFTSATVGANLEAAMAEAVRFKTVGPSGNGGLNTPKHTNLQPLFERILAVPDVGTAWSAGVRPVDDFVKARGDVAHRGGQANYVRFSTLTSAVSLVSKTVVETDNFLSDHLRAMLNPPHRPWNRKA